jgi:HEAT repeat protein
MPTEPTNAEKIRKLKWSYLSTATNTVFGQFTFFGTVFILFLDGLGLSKTSIGILLSLVPFFGLTALFTAPAVARFGYKRTFLTFWALRKAVAACLLLTPWVLGAFGATAASVYVGVIVAAFALCRAIGETGNYPWVQEYVPPSLLGKYSATENRIIAICSLLAVSVAGFVVGRAQGMSGFMALIAAGVVFGAAAVWAASFLPGGAPLRSRGSARATFRALAGPARDGDFRRYLLAVAFITLGIGPVTAFLPLFLGEQVGLAPGQVVWLQTGGMLGGLLSSFMWGWAADRYGSRPVMLSALAMLAIIPAFWFVLPRQSPASVYLAFAVIFVSGLVGLGWTVGANRQLFVNLVPPEHKSEYMALNYAWVGLVGGLSQVLGGRVLDLTGNISGRLLFINFDPYSVLFAAGMLLPAAAGLLLRRVRSDSGVSVGDFAGMFLHGNPFMAAESLIRYGRAMDEQATVSVTERLGQARSRLTVEELLEALADPRFNVRFEAIIAMTRVPPDPRLIEALGDLVICGEPAMSVIAAWALGRLGDRRAVPALRQGLGSRYRSVQAHSARALGTLQDAELQAELLEQFNREGDTGLRMAYASALGKLGTQQAVGGLLGFLCALPDEGARHELALALSRLVGDERYFIQLWRGSRGDAGTAAAQALAALKRRLGRGADRAELAAQVEACADHFARHRMDNGAQALSGVVEALREANLPRAYDASEAAVLGECALRLREFGAARWEYVLLALHTLNHNGAG